MKRIVASVALMSALLAACVAPVGAVSSHYLTLARLHSLSVPSVGCVDVTYAASHGLLEAVEVRWLGEVGLFCPDRTVTKEQVPSEQYVVMLALAAKRQLSCADVVWNGERGYLTWTALVTVAGFGACLIPQYARMVALQASGQLTCPDVYWNFRVGRITYGDSYWLSRAIGCAFDVIDPSRPVI